jgi:hypothetical protein
MLQSIILITTGAGDKQFLKTPASLTDIATARDQTKPYSHSIVPGGFDVMSYTTRLIPRTSLTIRDEIARNTSYGSAAQSAVMPSSLSTARIAHVYAYVRWSPITPTDFTGNKTAKLCHTFL